MICSKKILPFLALEDSEREKEVIEEVAVAGKGQLISKGLFVFSILPKNVQKIRIHYSSRILSLCSFFGELKTPKRHFEIN